MRKEIGDIYDFKTIHLLKRSINRMDLHGPPAIEIHLVATDGIGVTSGKLGVFPSSFNPLTVSHVELIERAMNDFGMNEVLLILDTKTLDKEHFGASLEDRLLMLLMYCEHKPHISVGLSSHGLFVDKITALRKIYPEGTDIYFIVGFDTIVRILDKRYYEDRARSLNALFNNCHFLAANRGDQRIDDIQTLFQKEENRKYIDRIKPFVISEFLASVSSTQVRDRIEKSRSVSELVPPAIDRFISETGLYHSKLTIGDMSTYDFRSQLIQHLFTLNQNKSSDVDLKKILRVAQSETSLGREVRRVTVLSGEEIPKRPEPTVPTQLAGNFDILTPLFTPEEARKEAYRCLQCEHPPCERHCLPGLPILELLRLVGQGEFEKAFLKMREAEPLCGITEYLCQTKENYCEYHCLSGTFFGEGNEIAIQTIFRTVWEYGMRECEARFDLTRIRPIPLGSRDSKIAVIGSGPAGIKAAMGLARLGYAVRLFERKGSIGGIPRFETPAFRFPAEAVFQQIEKDIGKCSIETVTGVSVGRDLTIADLLNEGFQAVFVATGLTIPKKLGIPGEDVKGVCTSIDLFHHFVGDGPEALSAEFGGKRGYVIDSGNTAMDTSRLLRRIGAEVTCIFWKNEPRALPKEVVAAKAEGVTFLLSSRPVELVADDNGIISHIRINRTCRNEQTGVWEPVPGTDEDLRADFCVYAIGAKPDVALDGMNRDDEGHILVNLETMQTSIPLLFAGGDVVERGNVSSAIRDGIKAAQAIHRMLSGKSERI